MPAMPGFYQRPQTINELADFMAGRVLSLLRIDHQLYPAWDPQADRE
jgi:4-hydroxy-3-polyprenylbenzoate decarboxylase